MQGASGIQLCCLGGLLMLQTPFTPHTPVSDLSTLTGSLRLLDWNNFFGHQCLLRMNRCLFSQIKSIWQEIREQVLQLLKVGGFEAKKQICQCSQLHCVTPVHLESVWISVKSCMEYSKDLGYAVSTKKPWWNTGLGWALNITCSRHDPSPSRSLQGIG